MRLSGFITKSTYRDIPMYLSETKWVDNIMKCKVGDIKTFPPELDMKDWPLMDQKYENVKVIIEIDLDERDI